MLLNFIVPYDKRKQSTLANVRDAHQPIFSITRNKFSDRQSVDDNFLPLLTSSFRICKIT